MSRRSRRATARLIAAVALIALVLPWSTGGTAGAQSDADTGTGEIRITRGVVMAETDAGPLTVDVYEPATAGTGRPAVVLVHGGAWFQGAPGDMDQQGRLLAEQGWVGFSVSYRLARIGQPTWPGNLTDVQRGVRWVAANAATYGADPARIALLGSSAGAHLSALVASVGTGLPGPDERPLPVAPTTTSTSSTVPAGQVASAPGAPGAPGSPGAPGTGGVDGAGAPATTPPPPQLVKAVALWSPPTELLDLVPDGEQPPASCGENPYCQVFWTVPFIPTMLGCGPAECRERYVEASLPTHVDARTVPVWLANSEEELIPIGQLQSLTTALADARVDHQVTVLEGHEHANEFTAEVWNDMVPFLAQRLGVAAPAPITFPADRTGPDVGLIVAVIGVVVLLGVTVAAVIVLQRRGQPA